MNLHSLNIFRITTVLVAEEGMEMETLKTHPKISMAIFSHLGKFAKKIKDLYCFKCVPCLPKTNYIIALKNSLSNLRKHIEVIKAN